MDEEGHAAVRASARPVDAPFASVLRAFAGPRVAWTDPEGLAAVGVGEAAVVRASGDRRFDEVNADAADLFDRIDEAPEGVARPRLFGGFAFHDGHESRAPWNGFPGAYFFLPRVQVTRADGETWVTTNAVDESPEAVLDEVERRVDAAPTTPAPPPGIARTERVPSRGEWEQQVQTAVERIRAGDLRKVVLAQSLTASLRSPFRLPETLDRLADTYGDCFRFAVDPGVGSTFFGATPERLVTREGTAVRTEALAGSIGRGGTPAEDERLATRLRDSEKVSHEHALVVEAIRDRLAPIADVRPGEQTVRKLDSVQHLRTPIEATLGEPTHVLDLVERLHPTPAVGGLPPEVARRTIRETEAFDRGWYAAPVGWFDASGDGAFAVGIRSAVATDSRAALFAGNGIVADSDPAEEWTELQLKYRPILDHLR
jgi:menaquinone-specific isochorismate synthase